ncbi:MAG: zf-HC2 domain-containing protein [Spirochaetaceae bacterium]|nr:zf-HC2 domain-containing protein [Spirochaetaceae bacterium]
MYTCPNKDIHSLYIDNELAEPYKTQYEKHLVACDSCRKELQKQQQIHLFFKEDAHSLQYTEEKLDVNFEKLQERLKYRQVTQQKPSLFSYALKFAPTIAAVVAFIFIFPLSNKSVSSHDYMPLNTPPIQANQVSVAPMKDKGLVVHGNLSSKAISSLLGTGQSYDVPQNIKTNIAYTDYFKPEFASKQDFVFTFDFEGNSHEIKDIMTEIYKTFSLNIEGTQGEQ